MMGEAVHTPTDEAEAASLVGDLARSGGTLALRGGGTRVDLGRPTTATATLSTRKLDGITLHEPAELVLSARGGTPLADIEATLAQHNQMLPFEPMDHRTLFGTQGAPSIGAVVAGNISGPRRIAAGAVRDSLIGVRLINGRGEAIKSGGRVMKNVTGLDLARLVTGSWGTLGLITEATFKLLPRPEHSLTVQCNGLDEARGIGLLTQALGSPFEPSAAAHLPAGIGHETARTILRLEGFKVSLDYRVGRLRKDLAAYGPLHVIEGPKSDALWRAVRDVHWLAEPRDQAIWRLSTAPTRGPEVMARLRSSLDADRAGGLRYLFDWGGGLIWLAVPAEGDAAAPAIRAAVAGSGGHATLVRAPAEVRMTVPVFQPPGPLGKLIAGIKSSFDPAGIFEPGHLHAGM